MYSTVPKRTSGRRLGSPYVFVIGSMRNSCGTVTKNNQIISTKKRDKKSYNY